MIRMAEDIITREDRQALATWLVEADQLTQGSLVSEMERRFASWLGRKHAVMVNSGSSALLLAWAARKEAQNQRFAGKRFAPTMRAVVPALCWSTTVSPAMQLGFTIHAADVDPGSWGSSDETLRGAMQDSNVDTVCVVHVLGIPCDAEEISKACRASNTFLIEDCCAAHGSSVMVDGAERKVGTFGNISTFSFFWGHAMSTVEGGIVCCDDDDMHELLVMLRAHGWAADLDDGRRERLCLDAGEQSIRSRFTFHVPGFNVRSTEINAFLGLRGLSRLDNMLAARRRNHRLYMKAMSENGFIFQRGSPQPVIGFGLLAKSPAHRLRVMDALGRANVECRVIGTGNITRQPMWHWQPVSMPVADAVHDRGFQVPCHHKLTKEEVAAICDIVMRA